MAKNRIQRVFVRCPEKRSSAKREIQWPAAEVVTRQNYGVIRVIMHRNGEFAVQGF
jgi:hypothetical protein